MCNIALIGKSFYFGLRQTIANIRLFLPSLLLGVLFYCILMVVGAILFDVPWRILLQHISGIKGKISSPMPFNVQDIYAFFGLVYFFVIDVVYFLYRIIIGLGLIRLGLNLYDKKNKPPIFSFPSKYEAVAACIAMIHMMVSLYIVGSLLEACIEIIKIFVENIGMVAVIMYLIISLIILRVVTQQYLFVVFYIVDRAMSSMDSISMSSKLVRLHFFTVFVFSFVCYLLVICGTMTIIGSIITDPFLAFSTAYLYRTFAPISQ